MKGPVCSGIASYLSRWFSGTARPWRFQFVLHACRARLPGDFGFYLHWHIRRRVLSHLVKAWWARIASPMPQLRMPVALFRSKEHRPGTPDDLGWGEIFPNLTVVAVDGDHYTMFDSPNLEALSARFTTSTLDVVRHTTSGTGPRTTRDRS